MQQAFIKVCGISISCTQEQQTFEDIVRKIKNASCVNALLRKRRNQNIFGKRFESKQSQVQVQMKFLSETKTASKNVLQ